MTNKEIIQLLIIMAFLVQNVMLTITLVLRIRRERERKARSK